MPGRNGLERRPGKNVVHVSAGHDLNGTTWHKANTTFVWLVIRPAAPEQNGHLALRLGGLKRYSIRAAMRSAASSCKPGTTCE